MPEAPAPTFVPSNKSINGLMDKENLTENFGNEV